MTCLLNRRSRIFGGTLGVLVYCMAMFPILNTVSIQATAFAEDKPKLSKEEKKILIEQGVAQYNSGNHAMAKKTLEQAKEVFPENFAVPYYLGLIYLEEGQLSAAIAEWRRYVAMDPKSENAIKIRKNLTLLLRKEAREYAKQAVANEAVLLSGPVADNTVAVTTFNNLGSQNLGALGKGMAAMVIHDLSQIPDLRVVERIKLQALLEEMKLSTSGLVDEKTAPTVGKLLKSKHVTSGSLADLEADTLQIASVVVDAEKNTTIGTQEAQGELKKFYDLEKEIACGIITDLGKDCDKAPGAFGKIHTKSLPALLAFSEGLDYFDQEKYDEAREMYQKALDEDPEFELAQTALMATPFSVMLVMSTSQMISGASSSGVSSTAAGTAVASGAAAGGVGAGTVAAAAGGVALVGGAAAAIGAGGGGSGGGDSTPTSVEGRWRGTWIGPDETSGEISLVLTQTNSSLTGTASITGSPCISTGNVTGTISGNTVRLNVASEADSASFNATYDDSSKTMNGTFEGTAGDCAGFAGTFSTTLTGGAEVSW